MCTATSECLAGRALRILGGKSELKFVALVPRKDVHARELAAKDRLVMPPHAFASCNADVETELARSRDHGRRVACPGHPRKRE